MCLVKSLGNLQRSTNKIVAERSQRFQPITGRLLFPIIMSYFSVTTPSGFSYNSTYRVPGPGTWHCIFDQGADMLFSVCSCFTGSAYRWSPFTVPPEPCSSSMTLDGLCSLIMASARSLESVKYVNEQWISYQRTKTTSTRVFVPIIDTFLVIHASRLQQTGWWPVSTVRCDSHRVMHYAI